MAPRGRPPKPKPGTSRMDAAIDAMKLLGFDEDMVKAKMLELLEEYEGHYVFIEMDAYKVLLDSLIDKKVVQAEISNSKAIMEDKGVNEDHAIVPADGFLDIPVCSSTTHAAVPSPPLPPLPPPLPPPVLDALPPLEPVQPQRRKPCYGWIDDNDDEENAIMENQEVNEDQAIVPADGFLHIPVCSPTTHAAVPPLPLPPLPPGLPLPLPPPPPPVLDALPPLEPRRRKPCYGWIDDDDDDDDEEVQFITLPSSLDGQISPPTQPETPNQPAHRQLSSEKKSRLNRRSRWDLRPEDM